MHKKYGIKVEFVKEAKIPSPDLKLVDEKNFVFLECKKYDAESLSDSLDLTGNSGEDTAFVSFLCFDDPPLLCFDDPPRA